MNGMRRLLIQHRIFLILLFIYLVFNVLTLKFYPKVSGDEGFLTRLAYLWNQNGIPIIDPNMSNVGANKGFRFFMLSGFSYFSSLGIIGSFFDFSLLGLRSHALLFATVCLVLTYLIALDLFDDKHKAIVSCFFLATSTHFMWHAHTIRQETMLTANLLLLVYCFLKGISKCSEIWIYVSSFLSGMAVSIHGNGFYFPIFLLVLALYYKRKNNSWLRLPVFFKAFLFTLSGTLIFILFDYWPVHQEFWKAFSSPFYINQGITNYYVSLSDFLSLGERQLIEIWATFWDSRCHNWMLYFIGYIIAIGGGLIFYTSQHKIIILMIVLLSGMLFLVLPSRVHYCYFIPLFMMLLGSFFCELWSRAKKIKLLLIVILGIWALNPLINTLARRNYDWEEQNKTIYSVIGNKSRFISDANFVFGLPAENLYVWYAIYDYDLQKFMIEEKIDFFIRDETTYGLFDKNEKLFKECTEVLSKRVFRTNIGEQKHHIYPNEIKIFDCRALRKFDSL